MYIHEAYHQYILRTRSSCMVTFVPCVWVPPALCNFKTSVSARTTTQNSNLQTIQLNTRTYFPYYHPYIMPGPTAPPSADILALPKEERMMLAIKAVTDASYKANGEHVLSPRRAAKMYNVAR